MKFLLLVFLVLAQPVQAFFKLPIGPGPISQLEHEEGYFPKLTAINLEGDKISIPGDLVGKKKLILIAFERKQQQDINTWLSASLDLVEAHPELSVYELPVIKEMNVFIRFNINNGMRYGIDSKSQREHTLTVYIDKDQFNSSLDIETNKEIICFLLDENNRIIYREAGLADTQKIQKLEKLLVNF